MLADCLNDLHYEFPELGGNARLRELILYIAEQCRDDPTFGAVKLNKILYWVDFDHYARTGQPITGVAYQKLSQGPVPKQMRPTLDDMRAAGEITYIESQVIDYSRRQVVALRKPNLDLFTEPELAFVDEVIERLRARTAQDVSDESHGIAWRVAGYQELIPYEAVFLSDEPLTDYDIKRSHELIREYGWEV